jgi:hypothetical protein
MIWKQQSWAASDVCPSLLRLSIGILLEYH